MATVSLARDLKHDRPIALKVIRPEVGAILGATPFTDSVVRVARNGTLETVAAGLKAEAAGNGTGLGSLLKDF
jgi:hypothetical protein